MMFSLNILFVPLLILSWHISSLRCNVIEKHRNELEKKNPSGNDKNFLSDYIFIDDGGDNEYEDENYLENGDSDNDDDDINDEYFDTDDSKAGFAVNQKRDLIKGPSYTPNINDVIADSELERENYDTEPMTSAGSKRKYIPDDESAGKSVLQRFISKKNYLRINTITHANNRHSIPDKSHGKTKRAFQLPNNANDISPSKKTRVSDENSRKEREKAIVSEALINLLYDWKGNEPLADDSNSPHTHSLTMSSDVESGEPEMDLSKTKDEIEAARTISKLRQASHTFSDAGKPVAATENDVSETVVANDAGDTEDVGLAKDAPTSLGENEEGQQKEASRSISTRKNKGKISVMVNVNINERAARRSKVEGANKNVTQPAAHESSGSGEAEDSEASGFLQKYGALKRLENSNINTGDDISALTASTKTRETKPKETDTSSGSGLSDLSPFVSSLYNPPSLTSFHPKNSTLNIFAGPAYPNNHEMKILNMAATAVPYTEDDESEASEATSKDTVLESGSGESEDDISLRTHSKKTKPHKPKIVKPMEVAAKITKKGSKVTEVQAKPANTENDETAEAERGETPENIFANKIAADREEKNNELEHNDKKTESLTQIKLSQTKEFNKAQEAEINSNSKAPNRSKKPKANLLHEAKEYKEKFSKELPNESDDNDEDLSEAAQILAGPENKKEKAPAAIEVTNNVTAKETEVTKVKSSMKKSAKNESKTSDSASETKVEINNPANVASVEDVNIEQVKEKQVPKSIPKEATVKKDSEDGGSSAPKVNQAPSAATIDNNDDQSEETLSKNELKIDADNSVSSEGKDNVKKSASNDDKYETLEEVREKFKKWENHLKDKQSTALSSEKEESKSNSNHKEQGKLSEKEKPNEKANELKSLSKQAKNENDVLSDESKSKDESETKSSEKKAKEIVDSGVSSLAEKNGAKTNTKNLVTDEEKDKAEQLKEIEEEKEEVNKPKEKINKDSSKDKPNEDQDTIKSWKEEEKILLAKLKNPFLDENSKLKKYKDDEEDDGEDELKKIIANKAAEKNKKLEKTQESPPPASKKQSKTKKLSDKKGKKEVKKVAASTAGKQIIGKITTTSKATDQELSAAVDNMFGSNKNTEKSKDLHHKSVADKSAILTSNPKKGKKSDTKNLEQLAKFKNQILNEVAKIDSLEAEYGKDSHSTKDLFEAKQVLEKDLKVVKELENSLLRKQPADQKSQHIQNFNKHNKDKKKHHVLPAVIKTDLAKTPATTAGSSNSDLGIDKTPVDKLDAEEVIPEARLGFDAESEEDKAQEKEDEKKAEMEEEKLFQVSNTLGKSKTKQKQKNYQKQHSYEYSYYVGGKASLEEDQKKKKKHPLEDIHALLKAEIKRLREKKKDRNSDAQLANIRKLVQQKLKSMLASGELDKTAFHSLAPDIKELGQLLKHRIKNEKKSMQKLKKSRSKKELKKLKDLKEKKKVSGKQLKAMKETQEPSLSEEANVIESIQQIGNSGLDQSNEPLKFDQPANQQQTADSGTEADATEPEGVLPHLKGASKEKLDAEMAKDMQEIDNNLSNQDVFQKIEKAHPEQSNKMKTLLTTLNQKLGEIYNKASKADKPAPAGGPHMNPAPHQAPPVAQQAPQPVPQPPANLQPQRQPPQQQHLQQAPVAQQRQESPVPSQFQQQQSNISTYQTQLAGEAENALPGIYVPQNYAQAQPQVPPSQPQNQLSGQVQAQAAPPIPPNTPGVVPINFPQQNAAAAAPVPSQAAGKVEAQNSYHLPPQGKGEMPAANSVQGTAETADDFDLEEPAAPQKALADDEPVDTLVESLERDITEVWSYRDMFPDADSLGLDNEKVHNTYANLGSLSGLNLRRALKRALRGEDVGLAVVGGSISKGGPFSEKGLDFVLRSYFYAVEDYWNKIIRPVTGSSMIIRDVSIGGIATDYYSYCLQNHLPDDRLTNIVLWELSANDMRRYDEGLRPKPQPLEQFTRNVLSYRARPALIFVNFFALFDWDPDLSTHCRNYEDEGEDDVSRYYKITSLSWRNMVCPLLRSGTSPLFTRSRLFSEDNFHPSILGHAQMSYIIIDYIRTEFLKNLVKMRNTFIADAVTRLQIPKSIYIPRPMYPHTYLWKPLCHTYMLVDNRSPNNTLPLDEDHSSNFRYTVVREFKIRSDKIVGMETKQKDQFLRYRMHIPRHQNGGVEPYKRLGIMTFTDDRQAQVQFDSDNPKMLDSRKKFLEGTLMKYVGENISPGEHELTIKSGSTGFLVCAIVLG